MRCFWTVLSILVVCSSTVRTDESAKDVLIDIYQSCVSQLSVDCIRPKAMQWISNVAKKDKIDLSDELSIVKTSSDEENEKRSADNILETVNSFLATHALKIQPTKLFQDETLRSYIPSSFQTGGLADGLVVPLSEDKSVEGRGFVKKVMIPFLLGLKFKSTVLVPLSLALIALKSWKAMTLGLLSLVLAGAMVIFKFAKPKIVNYEIVHFPHHPHHHVDHHPIIHEAPHWARQFESNQIPYHGYKN